MVTSVKCTFKMSFYGTHVDGSLLRHSVNCSPYGKQFLTYLVI